MQTHSYRAYTVIFYLFPLNRGRRFTGHVIHNAVYALHFVDNTAGHGVQDFIGDTGPITGHAVAGEYGPQGYSVAAVSYTHLTLPTSDLV